MSKRQTYIRPNRIKRAILNGAVCGALLSGGALIGGVVQHTIDTQSTPNTAYSNVLHIKACMLEDSRNCVWNAGVQGNGEGVSFIDYNGKAYYVE